MPKGAARPGTRRAPARTSPRFSASTTAVVAIGAVVLVVVVLVIVKVSGPSTAVTSHDHAPAVTPASAAVVAALTGIPVSEMDAVGLPPSVTAPTVDSSQPPLVLHGKPGAIYIGGEFCPNCASERWAVIAAFAKFGSFRGLKETTSSPWDGTPFATFSFTGATYSSTLVTFEPVEYEGNDTNGLGTRKVIHSLTTVQSQLWTAYSDRFSGGREGFPFVDIGNRALVIGRSYDPSVLTGLSQKEIAARLSHPSDPVTQGVVGATTYLTAAICSMTGRQPAAVCSATAVTAAAQAMGLH
ncbi:MAG TPA: DUF929 family protein [Acidimicrobiales bacterium]|nr:DUF929 family protein [Acidimicrobiales bacterium]